MRSLLILTVLLFASISGSGAQEHHHHASDPRLTCVDQDVPFGHFGYKHCTLHKFGTIPELLNRTKTSCCGGEYSGECRATVLEWRNGSAYAQIDGLTCPVTTAQIYYDIPFPLGIFAVVCAGSAENVAGQKQCPVTYCVAAAPGT